MAAILPLDVYAMSQSLLNDQIGAVYDNGVLQPYLNIALRDLANLLERANVPVTNNTSAVIDLPAGGSTIGDPNDANSPSLPEDLVEIQGLYQRMNEDQNYYLITKLEFLTAVIDTPETSYIPFWTYQENFIKLIPANADLEIKINYIKNAIPTVGNDNEPINIIGALNYLGYRTAALASRYVGENPTRADTLDMSAMQEWDKMEGISTKGRQSISTRRRPFRTRNWGGTALGW